MSEAFKDFVGGLGNLATVVGNEKIPILDPVSGVTKYIYTNQVGNAPTTYKATVLARSPLLHYYPMNDTAGATVLADAKGTTNLTINGSVATGYPGIVNDGETCAYFPGGASGVDNVTINNSIFTGLFASSSDVCLSLVFKLFGTNAGGSGPVVFLSCDPSNNLDFDIECVAVGGYTTIPFEFLASFNDDPSAGSSGFSVSPWRTFQMHANYDHTAHTVKVYFNNILAYTSPSATITLSGSDGAIGMYSHSPGYPFKGLMSDFAVYNAQLDASDRATDVANLGLAYA